MNIIKQTWKNRSEILISDLRKRGLNMLSGHDIFTEDDVQIAIAIAETCRNTDKFSVSLLQRKFLKGYIWSAKLMEELELRRIVGQVTYKGYREVLNHEEFIEISVEDKEGTHILKSNRDCVWKCPSCNVEMKITKEDLNTDNKLIRPKCNGCNREMTLNYWLDCQE